MSVPPLKVKKTIQGVLKLLENHAPASAAESWDTVGLILGGDVHAPCTQVVVSIDLTFEAVRLAVQNQCSVIVTHHPAVFQRSGQPAQWWTGTPLYEAARNGLAVIACHTNFDRCALEVPQRVSEGLGIRLLGRLAENPHERIQRFDSGLGYGLWGDLTESRALADIVKDVKKLFNINGFMVTHQPPREISRVGFVAGKGTSFVESAIELGCDLFLTGEAGYHPVFRSANRGMTVLEMGHAESEKFFIEVVQDWLVGAGFGVMPIQTPLQRFVSGDKE